MSKNSLYLVGLIAVCVGWSLSILASGKKRVRVVSTPDLSEQIESCLPKYLEVNTRWKLKLNYEKVDGAINILVVDDLNLSHKVIKKSFKNMPYVRIFSAFSGEDAINIMKFFNSRKIEVHFILMDYEMGNNRTGRQTLVDLGDQELLDSKICIIAHSSRQELNEEMMEVGATFSIEKGKSLVDYKALILEFQIQYRGTYDLEDDEIIN